MKTFYDKDVEQTLKQTNSTVEGLSSSEAQKRLEQYGENVLPQKKPKSKLVRFLSQFADVMIIILFVAAMISIVIAIVEKEYSEMIDGFIIFAIVLLNAVLGFVQEMKAEKEMKALISMSEPEVKVFRDGELKKVQSHAIVVGDVISLEAGDIIPADVRFIDTINAKCDESSLTGESLAVGKNAGVVCADKTPLGDRKNSGFKGSVLTSGRATAVVVATGKDTELGKIATMLTETEKQETPLQKNIKAVGKIITIIVLVVAAITFVLELTTSGKTDVVEAFLTAVAISVAAIPESLPAVITIIMSFGVARLSKKKAIVKRLHAVETLGSTQVICSDKTGTLTQNKMTVVALYNNNKYLEAKAEFDKTELATLIECMALCNDSVKTKNGFVGDPTETALCDYALVCGKDKQQLNQDQKRVGEIPFDSNRKLMTTVNQKDGKLVAYTKGAPDIVISRCDRILLDGKIVEFTEELKQQVLSANKQMGDNALRVLGCAINPLDYVADQVETENISEQNLVFVGLVGMIDPPRDEAKHAVEKCKQAKMLPIMITGDHANTAFAIAKQIGIAENESQVMLGAKLDELSDEEYKKIIYDIRVYARVSPENKVRIVKTFEELGKVVAMTGDGVNDAPSLKTANIGVGMGITGTDVTKEVADMLVTDDNFATIVIAVEEGRKIYTNIKKTIAFLFSANFAEILSLLLATIFFPQYIFLAPVQILFVNLITDSLPAIALGMEPPEKNLMQQPPRESKKTVFSDGTGWQIVIMGAIQTLAILLCFIIGENTSEVVGTTMAFYCLNLVQLFYLLSMRTTASFFTSNPFKNKWIWIAIGFAVAIFLLLAFTPLCSILGLTYLSLAEWGIVIGISFAVLPISELVKFVLYEVKKHKKQ